MTERLKLIELNEIKQIRITCKKCGTAVKVGIDRLSHLNKCPECGADYYGLQGVLIDFRDVLKRRDEEKGFSVQIELPEDAK